MATLLRFWRSTSVSLSSLSRGAAAGARLCSSTNGDNNSSTEVTVNQKGSGVAEYVHPEDLVCDHSSLHTVIKDNFSNSQMLIVLYQ